MYLLICIFGPVALYYEIKICYVMLCYVTLVKTLYFQDLAEINIHGHLIYSNFSCNNFLKMFLPQTIKDCDDHPNSRISSTEM